MADAMLSAAAERIVALIAEQARYHVNMVKGAEKEALSLAQNLETIRTVLEDAENRRFKDKNVNYWISRLEATSYEMEDVLDEWDYALLKLRIDARAPKQTVCSFMPSFSCFKKIVVRHHIAKKVRNVKEQLDKILKEKDQYGFVISQPKDQYGFVISQPSTDPLLESRRSQSSIDFTKVHGRDKDRDILVSKLIDNDVSQEELGVLVVSIVGVGGLGKTTLAQLVYNHSRVEEYFKLRIWICVSDPFDLVAIAKGILESIEKGSSPNTDQLDVLFKRIKESLSGKKFLLVLDDVWTEDYNKWEPLETNLRCGEIGSKILVTTRSERVAKITGTRESEIFSPGLLSDDDCWLFMCRMALSGRNEMGFEEIGRKIAKKCNGLPLAAKTLGSVLRFKSTLEEWENVLNSEVWKMEKAEVDIFPHLLLSYNELSPILKRCFSYCAIFPKDYEIDVETLIEKWMALGYLGSNIDDMELKGRECFDVLAARSLFQDFEKDVLGEIKRFKMHDIVHDFAQFLRKSGRVEEVGMNKTTCQVCKTSLLSTVNEFKSSFSRIRDHANICNCLVHLRVLGLFGVPQGMENLIHLRWLDLDGSNELTHEKLKIIFQLYNLQTLKLRGCISEEIPWEIENLIHLRYLRLNENTSLKVLPKEIGTLTHLRRLDLSENICLEELPSEIGKLIHLRHLDLSKNYSLKELPKEIGNLIDLRFLDLSENESLEELPKEIENLIHLRCLDLSWDGSLKALPNEIGCLFHLERLDLSGNKSLQELPNEIGKLIHLSHLNLWGNKSLEKLPKEIGNLIQLAHLDLSFSSLRELPESICELHNLQTLDVKYCRSLRRLPEGLAHLHGLRTLTEFKGGSGGNKLGLLKNLNHLGGTLRLKIRLDSDDDPEEVIKDFREAELTNKMHIQKLEIVFEDEMDENEPSSSSRVRMGVIDALQPHPNLGELEIWSYGGSSLSLGLMASSLNQLKRVVLASCNHLMQLPPLGKLPCLEDIQITCMRELEIVGREFLNFHESFSGSMIAYPKLKNLEFSFCTKWKEWEDITTEEEESTDFQVMPCLTKLEIRYCTGLTALPHRLLRKLSSLETLDIYGSKQLQQR